MKDEVKDILLELEDQGLKIKVDSKKTFRSSLEDEINSFIEVSIMRPYGSPDRVIPGIQQPPGGKYPGELFFWYEVKDAIIRLNDWYYEYSQNEYTPGINYELIRGLDKIGIKHNTNSPFRMFAGGVEFGFGWYKPEDFSGLGDYISFTSLRIEMKV
jgi:hypothetical protein